MSEPYFATLLLDEQKKAVENVLAVAKTVAQNGYIDEDTNTWKID